MSRRISLRTILFCCCLATLGAGAAVPTQFSAGTAEVRDFVAASATIGYAGVVGGGLWKTTNAGANWTKTSLNAKTVWKIAVNPNSGGARLFAATEQGLFRSTDSGATWQQLTQDPTRAVAIAGSPAAGGPETILIGVTGAGVYKSTDSGTTLTRSSGTGGSAIDSTDVIGLAFYPGSSTIGYAVLQCNIDDQPAPLSGNFGGVYRTADGGVTWAAMNGGLPTPDSTRPCVNAIAANGTTVVVGIKDLSTNQGSTYRITASGTLTWTASVSNPFGVEFLGPDFSNASGYFLGSNQFGPWRSTDGGNSFVQVYAQGTDPDFTAKTFAVGSFTATTWVAGINGLGLFRTTTGASPDRKSVV